MPRPAKSLADRADDVCAAFDAVKPALLAAVAADSDPNVTPDERRKLWEVVETHGATIHRQSRILAGKSRGG